MWVKAERAGAQLGASDSCGRRRLRTGWPVALVALGFGLIAACGGGSDQAAEPTPTALTDTATATADTPEVTPDPTAEVTPDPTTAAEPETPEEPEPTEPAEPDAVVEPMEPWLVQFGSTGSETAFGLATAPNQDLIVVFSTSQEGTSGAAPTRDVSVQRYSRTGELIWEKIFGGPSNDSPLGVSVTPTGQIYVGGFTEGDLAAENQGSADVWLARFEPDGTEVWRRQFGGEAWDRGFDVTAFDGGAYITGYSASVLDPGTHAGGFDGFVARFSEDGDMEWLRHVGTESTDWGQGSALAPDGGVYLTGYTEGDLGGPSAGDKDAFVARLSPDGDVLWVQQFGSEGLDWTQGVGTAADGGVFVVGSTEGSVGAPNAGGRDVLFAAFDQDGNERAMTQLGGADLDSAFEVRQVGEAVVLTAGLTNEVADTEAFGERDAALIWLDAKGAVTHIERFGTAEVDDATGLAVLDDGTVAFTGYTFGTLTDGGGGDADIFIGTASPDGMAPITTAPE